MFFSAHAQASQGANAAPGSGMSSLIFIIGIFVLFYFLMLRPQQKKQKELKNLINSLKKHDEVMTAGGILGRITALDEQFVDIEIANGIVIKIQRTSIANVLPAGTIKSVK